MYIRVARMRRASAIASLLGFGGLELQVLMAPLQCL